MNVLRKAPSKDIVTETPLEFVVSTADKDRHGDVIDVGGWDTREFEQNSIALLNHDAGFVIGRWGKPSVVNNQLRAHLTLAPHNTSERINEVRTLIHAGILRSTSVGFIPLEQEPFGKGIRYKRQKLLEISVVSIPSNASATLVQAKRVEARALGISTSSIDKIFRQSHNASGSERQATAARKLAASAFTTFTPAERAKILAAKAKRDADETATLYQLERALDMIEALRDEIKTTKPNSFSDFADWDRHRKLERSLKSWTTIFDMYAAKL